MKKAFAIYVLLLALILCVDSITSKPVIKKKQVESGLQLNPENDFTDGYATTFGGFSQSSLLHEELQQTTLHALNYCNLINCVSYNQAKQHYTYFKPILYHAVFLINRVLRL